MEFTELPIKSTEYRKHRKNASRQKNGYLGRTFLGGSLMRGTICTSLHKCSHLPAKQVERVGTAAWEACKVGKKNPNLLPRYTELSSFWATPMRQVICCVAYSCRTCRYVRAKDHLQSKAHVWCSGFDSDPGPFWWSLHVLPEPAKVTSDSSHKFG